MTNMDNIKADLDSIYIGNLFTIEADLELPTKGRHGSEITWASSFKHIIDSTGKVTRPRTGSGNRPVTLTATASMGGESASRDFEATVLEQPGRLATTGVLPVKANIARGENYSLPGIVII